MSKQFGAGLCYSLLLGVSSQLSVWLRVWKHRARHWRCLDLDLRAGEVTWHEPTLWELGAG